MIVIPATIAGRSSNLLVSTGGAFSSLDTAFADRLGLPHYKLTGSLVLKDSSGSPRRDRTSVESMTVGGLSRTQTDFLLIQDDSVSVAGTEAFGTFGYDFLSRYDVEFDMAQNRFGLYSRRCKGSVVYWAKDYVEIPFHTRMGVPVVTVVLDGEKISAIVSTGSSYSSLDIDRAARSFGIKTVKAGASQNEPSLHKFGTLSVGGLEFHDVDVRLTDMGIDIDMALGMAELRRMHLYMTSINQKKIYATWADGTL